MMWFHSVIGTEKKSRKKDVPPGIGEQEKINNLNHNRIFFLQKFENNPNKQTRGICFIQK